MDSIPYSEMRAHLAETIKRLEVRDEAVYISRRGQPAAVLMSVAEYRRLTGGENSVGRALSAWRARQADYLASPEAEEDPFANLRDRSVDGGRPPLDFGSGPEAPKETPEETPGKLNPSQPKSGAAQAD